MWTWHRKLSLLSRPGCIIAADRHITHCMSTSRKCLPSYFYSVHWKTGVSNFVLNICSGMKGQVCKAHDGRVPGSAPAEAQHSRRVVAPPPPQPPQTAPREIPDQSPGISSWKPTFSRNIAVSCSLLTLPAQSKWLHGWFLILRIGPFNTTRVFLFP